MFQADTGDELAAPWLVGLLAKRGDIEGLRARADTGDRFAVWSRCGPSGGDTEEAITLLRARAD